MPKHCRERQIQFTYHAHARGFAEVSLSKKSKSYKDTNRTKPKCTNRTKPEYGKQSNLCWAKLKRGFVFGWGSARSCRHC